MCCAIAVWKYNCRDVWIRKPNCFCEYNNFILRVTCEEHLSIILYSHRFMSRKRPLPFFLSSCLLFVFWLLACNLSTFWLSATCLLPDFFLSAWLPFCLSDFCSWSLFAARMSLSTRYFTYGISWHLSSWHLVPGTTRSWHFSSCTGSFKEHEKSLTF